ncbi:hypothetical protein [Ascidiimonas sp. W6]
MRHIELSFFNLNFLEVSNSFASLPYIRQNKPDELDRCTGYLRISG